MILAVEMYFLGFQCVLPPGFLDSSVPTNVPSLQPPLGLQSSPTPLAPSKVVSTAIMTFLYVISTTIIVHP